MKIILILIIIIALSPAANGQKRSTLWDWSDAALAGSFIADEATTQGVFNRCPNCKELGVIKSTPPRIGVKVGIFSAFKLIDWRSPDTRKGSRWAKAGIAAVFALVSYKNAKIK
jgi:hypothetical protein